MSACHRKAAGPLPGRAHGWGPPLWKPLRQQGPMISALLVPPGLVVISDFHFEFAKTVLTLKGAVVIYRCCRLHNSTANHHPTKDEINISVKVQNGFLLSQRLVYHPPVCNMTSHWDHVTIRSKHVLLHNSGWTLNGPRL